MKKWGLRFVAALCAVFLLVGGALAEIQPLDLDIMTHGFPAQPSGWVSKEEYHDESIDIAVSHKTRKPKSSRTKTVCRWITINVAHPSQLRTAMSMDSFEDPTTVSAKTLAKHVNALVALNGDYFKYNYVGYVMRQGVLYRSALDGSLDSLIIDDQGDFHGVLRATAESMEQAVSDLEAQGRSPVNVFNFGPVLVQDGRLVYEDGEYPAGHYSRMATQRIALLQLNHLQYAVVEIDSDGGNGTGMNLEELAKFILEIFPDCKLAYNLDGGGSTQLIVNDRKLMKTVSGRAVCDIIYFASAQKPEE